MKPAEDRDLSEVKCHKLHPLKHPFSPGQLISVDKLPFQGISSSHLEFGILSGKDTMQKGQKAQFPKITYIMYITDARSVCFILGYLVRGRH